MDFFLGRCYKETNFDQKEFKICDKADYYSQEEIPVDRGKKLKEREELRKENQKIERNERMNLLDITKSSFIKQKENEQNYLKEKENEINRSIDEIENEKEKMKMELEKIYKEKEEKMIYAQNQEKESLRRYESEIKKRENELKAKIEDFEKEKEFLKNEKNEIIKQKNNLEKEYKQKEKEIKEKENELLQKEIILNKEKNKLKQLETNLTKEQNELNKKEKEFNQKEINLNEKVNELKIKENEIKENVINLNKEKNNLKEKENELNKKEIKINNEKDKLKEKENIFKQKENEFNQKEINLNNEKNELKKKENVLKQKENEFNLKEINFNNKNNEFKEKENIFKQKENELNKKEIKINNEKNELKEKENIFNQKENEFKQKQINLNNKNNELKQKENEINKREINLNKEKIDFEKNKKEIIKKELEEEKKPILIGLNNIGATCYMNSTLQCLSNTKPLTEYFLKKFKKSEKNIMVNEYYDLLLNLWNRAKNNTAYSPNSFKEVLSKENPLFAGIAANDSKDLINFLLERFHQELNEVKPNTVNNNNIINPQDQTNEQYMLDIFLKEFKEKYNSAISSMFYGLMGTKSQCLGCNVLKYNFQVYSFLEFPLQQVNQYCFNNGRRPLYNNDGTNPDVDLYECFEYYNKIDLMNGDNQMYCNMCNKLSDSYYSTTIYSLPINLIINLNRGRGAVYECKVNFPEQLNLINFVTLKNGITVYELYSVICGLGPSSMSGHFVSYCKNRIDNKWYLYNDGIVSLCHKKYQYRDGIPYILFYRALGDF